MRSRIGRSLNSTRRLAQMLGTLFENVLLQDSEDAADWAAVNLYKPGEREKLGPSRRKQLVYSLHE